MNNREPMTKEKSRYVDRGILLPAFADKGLALCPQCHGPAWVTCKSRYSVPFNPQGARVHCLKCSFSRTGLTAWFGPIAGTIKKRCPVCGFWVKQGIKRKTSKSRLEKTKTAACASCGQQSKFPVEWKAERFKGAPVDPAYGLPLLLQTPCAGNTLWVYNKRHLQELRSYIGAKLRERASESLGRVVIRKWSMFARLPQWMKAAKNREHMLRGLERLERVLQETGFKAE